MNLLSFASYLLVRNGEAMTTFSSSAIDDFAAAFSFHARAESELAVSLGLAGLVGAFHDPGSLGLWLTTRGEAAASTYSTIMLGQYRIYPRLSSTPRQE